MVSTLSGRSNQCGTKNMHGMQYLFLDVCANKCIPCFLLNCHILSRSGFTANQEVLIITALCDIVYVWYACLMWDCEAKAVLSFDICDDLVRIHIITALYDIVQVWSVCCLIWDGGMFDLSISVMIWFGFIAPHVILYSLQLKKMKHKR